MLTLHVYVRVDFFVDHIQLMFIACSVSGNYLNEILAYMEYLETHCSAIQIKIQKENNWSKLFWRCRLQNFAILPRVPFH